MGLVKEFKVFISRGNVMDMAVGVIIGAAFKTIVDSLVANIIMPVIGLVTAGINFSDIKTILREAAGDQPEVAIEWGVFIESIISFLIIAFVIFLMIKAVNKLRENAAKLMKEQEAAEEEEAGPTESELLTSILEELQKQNKAS